MFDHPDMDCDPHIWGNTLGTENVTNNTEDYVKAVVLEEWFACFRVLKKCDECNFKSKKR